MGLERLLTVLQGTRSVFGCDVFEPWVRTVSNLWSLTGSPLRVTCDHLRSGIVVGGEGVRPSNTGRGYVLRFGLGAGRPEVRDVLLDEERRFRTLLARGRRLVSRRLLSRRDPTEPPGALGEDDFRYLHETHGCPVSWSPTCCSTTTGSRRTSRSRTRGEVDHGGTKFGVPCTGAGTARRRVGLPVRSGRSAHRHSVGARGSLDPYF